MGQLAAVETAESASAPSQQLLEIAVIDIDLTESGLAEAGADELNRAQISILRAGVYFIALKARVGYGQFKTEIEAVGVNERAAQRAMQIARYVESLPPASAKRIAALPPRKILPLVNADPEVVAEILESGELDGDEPLSVRELQQRLKDAEQAVADAAAREKAAKLETRRLKQELGAESPHISKAHSALRDRAVSLLERIACEAQLLSVDVVAPLLVDAESDDATQRSDASVVAGGAYHTLLAAIADLAESAKQIEDAFGSAVTHGLTPAMQYQPEEAMRLRTLREQALSVAQSDARADKARAQKDNGLRGRRVQA